MTSETFASQKISQRQVFMEETNKKIAFWEEHRPPIELHASSTSIII